MCPRMLILASCLVKVERYPPSDPVDYCEGVNCAPWCGLVAKKLGG